MFLVLGFALGTLVFPPASLASDQPAPRAANPSPLEKTGPALQPAVEIEEDVYSYEPANNGAGPMWCSGSTCLVRIGDEVFASGLETMKDAAPLNNCRWLLFKRGMNGWELLQADPEGRTREPSPMAGFPDGSLWLSANPTLGRGPEPDGGPARPELFEFFTTPAKSGPETLSANPPLHPSLEGIRQDAPEAQLPSSEGQGVSSAAQSANFQATDRPVTRPADTLSPVGGEGRVRGLAKGARREVLPVTNLSPVWKGTPRFSEHSYRSFAADGPARELILFQNVGYTHAEWTFRNAEGQWAAQGQLPWPWGAEYDKPQPIRICYPNVALRNRAVHFCGVSDILEPYQAWRDYKKELTGRAWDYDFRRLFYTWSKDIGTGRFEDWIEIASRDKTAGWISPGDLWVAPDGAAHIVWTERAADERLRKKFFPDVQQTQALNYTVVREGKVAERRALVIGGEGHSKEMPSAARFHATPDHRLFVSYYVQGAGAAGQAVSENRILEILPGGQVSAPVRLPLQKPFNNYFTATVRAGSPPSNVLEMLGQQVGSSKTISYARVRLW